MYKANGIWCNQSKTGRTPSWFYTNANKISNHTTESRRQKRVFSILHKNLSEIQEIKCNTVVYDRSVAEFLRNTGWESLWASTSAHNPQRWPRGRTVDHCSQEEDKVGQSQYIPRPRGRGQSISLLRQLATGSISTCNLIFVSLPLLCSILFHLWKKGYFNSSLEFQTLLPTPRKVGDNAMMKWWAIFHFEMEMFPLSREGRRLWHSGGGGHPIYIHSFIWIKLIFK